MNSFVITPPQKMLWMLCSSLLIHLAKTLVSLLTDSSQLFGRTSLSASGAANTTRFFPDVGPALLKRWFIRHKALKFHVETFRWIFQMFCRKLQSLLSSCTHQFNVLMCPRGVWSDSADSRNDQTAEAFDPDRIVCFRPVWLNRKSNAHQIPEHSSQV